MEKLLYGPEEIAELLAVSRSTAYKLIKDGDIPSFRIGTLIKVRREDLERWVKAHEQPLAGGEHAQGDSR